MRDGFEKQNRRKRRMEYDRKHRIMREEFDPKAIRRRARHEKERAREFLDSWEARQRAMRSPQKHAGFIGKIKNKLINQQKNG